MPTRIEMRRYGPPEVLEPAEHADYEPGLGEVVVRVVLAAVNRADCFIRSGEWPQRGGWPYVPGLECCGTVERLGEGVDDFVLGEPVITMMQKLGGIHGTRPGGYQETVLVPAKTVARVPAALDLRLVGALGLAAVTAVEATRVLEVRPGMRVLVTGGSSAVGTLAIQFLQDLGAEVVATTTRPEKSDALSGPSRLLTRATWGGPRGSIPYTASSTWSATRPSPAASRASTTAAASYSWAGPPAAS